MTWGGEFNGSGEEMGQGRGLPEETGIFRDSSSAQPGHSTQRNVDVLLGGGLSVLARSFLILRV